MLTMQHHHHPPKNPPLGNTGLVFRVKAKTSFFSIIQELTLFAIKTDFIKDLLLILGTMLRTTFKRFNYAVVLAMHMCVLFMTWIFHAVDAR